MGRISISLSDLRRAIQQCEQLQQRLIQQEQQMRSIYGRLQDWKGESAVKLSAKMSTFLEGTTSKLAELEEHKEQLKRYIRKMEEADREDRRKAPSPY
ncbi:WXG100 family type VII secretion target [Paenibacillus sp. AD87]|uniref:WXG100 family type VII secretion target n=1 Tax=Paenibacillus sp. AD87 TaxID=1528787 RepID=UPI0007E48E27|nr:WXG100 family type VII secretion target [Paenibacillus sp. AD87]OAX50831.1 hypothetical protein gpAD87_21740 [Paenibacillus sp. AD87]